MVYQARLESASVAPGDRGFESHPLRQASGLRWYTKVGKEIIFLVEESAEGGYEAKALGYSIYTEGESLGKLKEAIKDAVKCHFEEEEMPRIVRIHLARDEVIAV